MALKNDPLESILEKCRHFAFDLNFTAAKKWKAAGPGRVIVGYLPIYFPREIVHAMGGLAVGIMGAGDRKQIIRGDAYYQSYICHLPRGVIEMALDSSLDQFDGFVFPAICDCVRNLSGMFRLANRGKFSRYFDYPQNFNESTGGVFYREEIGKICADITAVNGRTLEADKLNHSIMLFNRNRELIEQLYSLRQEFPWRLSAVDNYHLIRAGLSIPVEEHNKILEDAIVCLETDRGEPMDNIRVVLSGSFCEQPPVGLIKSIEMAGVYIIEDDLMLGSRWIQGPVPANTKDPVGALVSSFLTNSPFTSCLYDVGNPKGNRLVALVKKRNADGVIFCAASFCDPALLDRPELQKACDREEIHHINFQFHENTGQFKVIREQAGTFSDSIKLWT